MATLRELGEFEVVRRLTAARDAETRAAGAATGVVVDGFTIDGGNTNFHDDVRRHAGGHRTTPVPNRRSIPERSPMRLLLFTHHRMPSPFSIASCPA